MSVAARRPVEYGDRETAMRGQILRTLVGSGVHGIALDGMDDRDEMGVFIEPATHVLGTHDRRDDYVSRTQPEGVRSGPGDVDLILYSLRKFLRLAIKGNPTMLLPLFAPEEHVITSTTHGQELRALRGAFLSAQAVERFLGYMEAQHERMMGGGKRNRVPNRPELIEQYGWDVKYGAHALRLAYQGHELAAYGSLTLPLPEPVKSLVLAVRTGEVGQLEVSARIRDIASQVRQQLDSGHLAVPARAGVDVIEAWSVQAHLRHWQGAL